MTSLTDILTTTKNIVTAINGAAQTYLSVQGALDSPTISAATVVKASAGRVCTVIVTTAGAAGAIYDSNSTSVTTKPIYVIPAVLGVYVLNFPVGLGLLVVPGAGQVVSVSYS